MTTNSLDTQSIARRVRELRLARNLTGRELADRAGIHHSTISRIETGSLGLTINTAARWCFAVGIGFREFIEPLIGREVKQSIRQSTNPLPAFDDRHAILDFFLWVAQDKAILTAPILDCIIPLMAEDKALEQDILTSLWCALVSKAYGFGKAKAGCLAQSFALSVMEDNSPIGKFNFIYPTHIDLAIVMNIYQNAGIVLYDDTQTYIRRARSTYQTLHPSSLKSKNKIEQGQFEDWPSSANDRVALLEIIQLNEQLVQQDEILALAWASAEFDTGISSIHHPHLRDNPALTRVLIILARWLSHLQPSELPLIPGLP